ncbi:MAG: rhodanese-like domain-containing protein [Ilumatobacter sp.]|nr:rhodanese-like domain-containing protein [bacterium]MDG1265225.1 rhodanese-like domain-containing protein [Ilumatobacter sp.]MDG2040241.1 rhodanese-like domain-containing protein [Ilumatobacter sp.]
MTNPTAVQLPRTDIIDTIDLQQMLLEHPTPRVLDVRTGGEFDCVHIEGSYNVPLDTLGEHARDLAEVEHPVVLVCKSGARADQAYSALTGAGKQRLHLLDGGLDAWIAGGGDVVRGTSETWALDRQVRLVAGSISLCGILLSMLLPKAKWIAGGIAAGLTFSAVTNTCAMGNMLAKLPYNRGRGCDIEDVLTELRGG